MYIILPLTLLLPRKQVGDFKLDPGHFHLSLHLTVGVVDDGEEHVQEDEEHNKDEEDEECRAEDRVSSLFNVHWIKPQYQQG